MSTQTTHRHEDGTEWIHHHSGVDGHGIQCWQWTCVNPDKSTTAHMCNQHGWIPISDKPADGTDAVICCAETKERFIERWYPSICDHERLGFTHWMPEMELPEVAL